MINRAALIACVSFLLFSTNASCTLQLIQVLTDEQSGVDGLDNPRNILFSDKLNKLFVTSADDNALAVFNINEAFQLTFAQVFKNERADIQGLEGATGITQLNADTFVVSGFYDHALTVFSASEGGKIRLLQRISQEADNPQNSKMKGPWELAINQKASHLYVANYLSNTILTYQITSNNHQPLKSVNISAPITEHDFGNPVALAFSPANSSLFVPGFEGHQLAVLGVNQKHQLFLKQAMQLDDLSGCLKPQKVLVNEPSNTLYIACADSASIIVLKRDVLKRDPLKKGIQEKYSLLQKISEQEAGADSLKGASSLSISKNGKRLFAAGEQGQGLLEFKISATGKLNLVTRYSGKDFELDELAHISSVTLVNNDQHLVVTQSKSDTLLVFDTGIEPQG